LCKKTLARDKSNLSQKFYAKKTAIFFGKKKEVAVFLYSIKF
jgi:hypothetical protein